MTKKQKMKAAHTMIHQSLIRFDGFCFRDGTGGLTQDEEDIINIIHEIAEKYRNEYSHIYNTSDILDAVKES